MVAVLILPWMCAIRSISPVRASAATPVVVELFESQGCSSCPPSERVMEDLRRHFGSSVILLTFHVHYWDSLGWKDPFSDAGFTERQKMYAEAFQQDSVYTPEMVVQGETGFIGSDAERAAGEITKRLEVGRLSPVLYVEKQASGAADVSVQLPPDLAKETRELTGVVYEDAPPVKVLRGENAGTTMSGDSAVRALLPLSVDASGRASIVIPLQRPWDPARLSIAVLVRGGSSQILAATSVPWNSKRI